MFLQVLPALNDKCEAGTLAPLFNPLLNEKMVAKRWKNATTYLKDKAGNVSDAPELLRELLHTIHCSITESIAHKTATLAFKKKKEKERRQRTTLAAQRVTDRPTSNSSAQVPPCDDDPSHAHALRGHTPSLPDPNCTCWGPYHGPVGTYYMAPMPALGHSCLLCKEARARGW